MSRVIEGKVIGRRTFHTTVECGVGILTLNKDNCENRLSLHVGQSVFLWFNETKKKWIIGEKDE